MAVRQPRSSEQRAWPQGRALLRRTALAVSSRWRDQEDGFASYAGGISPAQTFGGDGDVRGAEPIARARPLAPQRRLSLSARHPERRQRRRLRDPEGA